MSFFQTLICWVRLKDNTAKLKKRNQPILKLTALVA